MSNAAVGRVYLAGPMTGLPDHNYPAFHAAAAKLRAQGHEVESPAEHAEPPPCGSYEGWLNLGIAKLIRCESVALLPGWEGSRGARIEHYLAIKLKMPVVFLEHA